MQITGIILSGGLSTRMGADKALLQINGKSLLERAIEICKPVCNEILISSNNSAHAKFGFPVVNDEIADCGPIGGIYTCLKRSETEWNLVISVDAAFVNQDFAEFLISETGDFDAIIPFHKKGKEPLVALYHKNCIPAIKERIKLNDYKMHNLLNVLNTKFTNVDSWVKKNPGIFKNLNRPEDFIF